ncbi:MAG: hypothetical protein MK095_10805, partial [Phycisphaerales bacterium]|nr:hypothetical protein [Phycisphaerales bacterium]
TSGVCVTLRHRGRSVGLGRAYASPEETAPDLIRIAVAEAIEAAANDDVISKLPDSVKAEAGTHLTLEMEFAGEVRALLGRTFQAATEKLRPGLDGIAMRHDDRWWYQFPSHLRLTNAVAGPDRLYSFALTAELSPRQLETLRDQGNISIYSFKTIDLAQPTPDAMPSMLIGGDVQVTQADVTKENLHAARESLVKHILQRIYVQDDDCRLMGTYTPSTDTHELQSPTDQDRFMIALALAKFAQSTSADEALRLEAEVAARQLLEPRVIDPESPAMPLKPSEASVWCMAIEELQADDDRLEERLEILRGYLQEMLMIEDHLVSRQSHDMTMAAAALAIAGSDADHKLATDAARRARDVLTIHQHAGLLPWLGWVEQETRNPNDELTAEQKSDLASLLLIRDQAIAVQANPAASRPDRLDAGGFQLQAGPRGVTSQSLRPSIFFAEMLQDDSYKDPERQAEWELAHQRFLRYLLQLSCRADHAGTWKHQDRTQGAIRASTWDARLHPTAQAMALMVLNNTSD